MSRLSAKMALFARKGMPPLRPGRRTWPIGMRNIRCRLRTGVPCPHPKICDASFLDLRSEHLPIYHGANPPAHPAKLLQFSNEILVRNFQLGPWIHVASEINNWSVAWNDDVISARALIHDRFERKGHEFVVADVMLVANGERLVQTVRNTAIYRPRM